MAKKRKVVERSGINPEAPVEPKIKPIELSTEVKARMIHLEREIRRYVKRNGGFRRNLHPDDKAKALELLEKDKKWSTRKQGRSGDRKPEHGWDETIHVPRFDNVDHAENQKKL
jgi:hypothetical protein